MRVSDLFESRNTKLGFFIKMMDKNTEKFNLVIDKEGSKYVGNITIDRKPEEIEFKLWKGLNLEETLASLLMTYGFESQIKISDTDDWTDIDVKLKANSLASDAKEVSKKIAGVNFDRIIVIRNKPTVYFNTPNLNGFMHTDNRGEWFDTITKEISKKIPKDIIEFESRL